MTLRRGLAWSLAIAVLVPAVVFLGLLAIYARSPVASLNATNTVLLGDRSAVRAGNGIPFARGLALDIWTPPASRPGPHPVLLFFYGGSWREGRRQDYGFAARAYAARGFVVVVPDYRKLPEGRFPAFMDDAAAALRWTSRDVARFGGDPARVAVAGHSVGAYIAAMLALDRRWAEQAGVAPDFIRAAVALAGPYQLYPFRWPPAREALGHAPDPRATEPIRFARRDAPPLWLATGDADEVIDPANSRALARRQRALGVRGTVLRIYPGVSHSGIIMALSSPFRRTAPVLDESIAFLNAAIPPRH